MEQISENLNWKVFALLTYTVKQFSYRRIPKY
jgi:hypothetical protein